MYPNPQDVLPLPSRPDVSQYRKRAKELVKACRTGNESIARWASQWVRDLVELQPNERRTEPDREARRRTEQIAEFARARLGSNCALTQAQFVIARAHGFDSWPKLMTHIGALSEGRSMISTFEIAADAVITGDLETLDRLIREDPSLVRARSGREHRATLLHYVSANGVENYRQKSPANIVDIARLLLDAGASIDAEADVYGGGATTLGLVVTSTPPRNAGVQLPLAELLLARGARMDDRIVNGCLMNGCPEAAGFLAERGAAVGLQEAAGIGRLDVVRALAERSDQRVTEKERVDALFMATWYGRSEIVAYLLDHGLGVDTRGSDGDTALHVAAYQGHVALVELLLKRGAPVDVLDDQYGTPPFVWALHAWLVDNHTPDESYHAVLKLLAGAGATVKLEWLDDERIRGNAELMRALVR